MMDDILFYSILSSSQLMPFNPRYANMICRLSKKFNLCQNELEKVMKNIDNRTNQYKSDVQFLNELFYNLSVFINEMRSSVSFDELLNSLDTWLVENIDKKSESEKPFLDFFARLDIFQKTKEEPTIRLDETERAAHSDEIERMASEFIKEVLQNLLFSVPCMAFPIHEMENTILYKTGIRQEYIPYARLLAIDKLENRIGNVADVYVTNVYLPNSCNNGSNDKLLLVVKWK